MRKISVREFYHNARLVDGLPEGKQLIVTANGKPKFIVSKATRPRMTRELAQERAIRSGKGRINSLSFLQSLKK